MRRGVECGRPSTSHLGSVDAPRSSTHTQHRLTSLAVALNPQSEVRRRSGVRILRVASGPPDRDPLALRRGLVCALVGLGEVNGNEGAIVAHEHELFAGDPLDVAVDPELSSLEGAGHVRLAKPE